MSVPGWLRDRGRRFLELRRALPLVAAGLLVVALALPMWRITLSAPQYPDALLIELYAYPRLEGDVREVQTLNQFVGFYFPDPVLLEPNYDVHENAVAVPEWSFGPLAFLAVAGAGVFVALAPTVRKLKIGLFCQAIGTLAVFAGSFVLIQFRLHQAGHSLDPGAPMTSVDAFTPPVFGSYEIANISGFATFGSGAYIAMVAVGLLLIAFLVRDSSATIWETPRLLRSLPARVSARITRRGCGHSDLGSRGDLGD